MKTNLIGISGKIGSGKDTVGIILQYLSSINKLTGSQKEYLKDLEYLSHILDKKSNYKIKKFAGKLKEIAALLIGCTVEQLEDRDFKEKELGEEWNIWVLVPDPDHNLFDGNCQLEEGIFSSIDEAKKYIKEHKIINVLDIEERALTPRKLLQLLGTEAGRQIIHPNIWVNALFADFENNKSDWLSGINSNWIITDCRFPNEAQAIKDRGGVVIRVNRLTEKQKIASLKARANRPNNAIELVLKEEHLSETALDDYDFDHVIDNNGSIEDLVEKVKQLKLI